MGFLLDNTLSSILLLIAMLFYFIALILKFKIIHKYCRMSIVFTILLFIQIIDQLDKEIFMVLRQISEMLFNFALLLFSRFRLLISNTKRHFLRTWIIIQ